MHEDFALSVLNCVRLCICASVCLCVCASVRLCFCASVHLCVCASVRLCVYASVHLWQLRCRNVLRKVHEELCNSNDGGLIPAAA